VNEYEMMGSELSVENIALGGSCCD
jgi:hypothetical protein